MRLSVAIEFVETPRVVPAPLILVEPLFEGAAFVAPVLTSTLQPLVSFLTSAPEAALAVWAVANGIASRTLRNCDFKFANVICSEDLDKFLNKRTIAFTCSERSGCNELWKLVRYKTKNEAEAFRVPRTSP
jgi:hypothetical protein